MDLLRKTNYLIEKARMIEDDRLGDEFECAVDLYYDKTRTPEEAQTFYQEEIEKSELDVKLQIIDAMPEIRSQISIVKAEYSLLAQDRKDFLENWRTVIIFPFYGTNMRKYIVNKLDIQQMHTYQGKKNRSRKMNARRNFLFTRNPIGGKSLKLGEMIPAPVEAARSIKVLRTLSKPCDGINMWWNIQKAILANCSKYTKKYKFFAKGLHSNSNRV